MESEFPDRFPWERKYYRNIIIPRGSNFIKCDMCVQAFPDVKTEIHNHIEHLNQVHRKTELTDHPDREYFREMFIINEENFEAICRTCQRVIVYKAYGLYLLKNHVEIYHKISSGTYKIIAKVETVCHMLDKYYIMGSKATCPKCDKEIDMTHSEIQAVGKVKELLEHYFSHRYKTKCFMFVKTRKE